MTLMPQDGAALLAPAAPQSPQNSNPGLLDYLSNPLEALRYEKKKREWATWAETEFNRMKNVRGNVERQWYINLAFYMGKQNIAVINSSANQLGFQLVTPKAPPWRVRMVTNKIRMMIRTEIAKLTSQRPIPVVIPATTEDEDYAAARVGEQILKSEFTDTNFDQTVRSWVWWGSVTGCSFLKSYWDPVKQDRSENPGKICIERVSPFHVFIPDLAEEDLENQPYVCHAMTKSPNWVKSTFGIAVEASQSATHDVLEQSFLNLMGTNDQKKDSVLVLEFWIKPNGHPDFPRGGMLTIIDGKAVQCIGYHPNEKMPVPHQEFPFYKYTGMPTGQFYGESIIVDLISLQKEYNRTSSQIIEAKNMASKPKLMAPRGSMNPRQITTEPGQVVLYTQGYEKPTPLEMPQLPQYVLEELNRLQQDMDDISGQHEISRGNTPSQVTAATAISYLQEQDDNKLSYQIAGIEHGVSKLGRHYLKYVAHYWDQPRMVRVVGRDGLFEAEHWRGSDLRGNTDVQIIAGSALPHSKAARQALLMDLMKLGLIPPEQGLEMLDIGNMEKILEDYLVDKRQAQRENIKMSQADPNELAQYFQNPGIQTDQNGQPIMGPDGRPQPMPPQPPLPVNSYDNHQVHVHLHNQFRKSQQFEILPEPIKVAFELHVQAHQMAMTMPSQAIDQYGNAGVEQPAPGGDPNAPGAEEGAPEESTSGSPPEGGGDPNSSAEETNAPVGPNQ